MILYQEGKEAAKRRGTTRPLPSRKVLKELSGAACPWCGDRRYYLVLRATAYGETVSLSARCSCCHQARNLFSKDRLAVDIERTGWTLLNAKAE